MIVLDTNLVSHLMARDEVVVTWLESLVPDELYLTSVTRAEVRFAIARLPKGRRRRELETRADELFLAMGHKTLPFDGAAADEYGLLLAERQATGRPMSQEDARIAAIARHRRAILATRNVRDFDECGISIINPFG
ncbi:hypothetical protein ASG90_03310 [Nocardioides sp. Soil797]|nr:hypothetical protein ASG90_03310 [Nocardioides sp. Soil797]